MIRNMEVFDPPMCCSTGVCGPSVDPALVQFASDFLWVAGQGVHVEKYNLAQQPQAFASNETVKAALAKYGNGCLPLILLNGAIVSKGRYRITQECLNNVAKHSGAREAAVAIKKREGDIFLSITDNGTGFDPGLVAVQDGLGIVGIRERVRLVNGTVSIHSQPGHGTQIEVRVPLTKRMDA